MARITMRKVQETKLSEVFSLYLASAAAKGVKDKTLKTYEQHFNAISKRLNVDSNISLTTSKNLDKMIHAMVFLSVSTIQPAYSSSGFSIILSFRSIIAGALRIWSTWITTMG